MASGLFLFSSGVSKQVSLPLVGREQGWGAEGSECGTTPPPHKAREAGWHCACGSPTSQPPPQWGGGVSIELPVNRAPNKRGQHLPLVGRGQGWGCWGLGAWGYPPLYPSLQAREAGWHCACSSPPSQPPPQGGRCFDRVACEPSAQQTRSAPLPFVGEAGRGKPATPRSPPT